jgi:hypothetical protein
MVSGRAEFISLPIIGSNLVAKLNCAGFVAYDALAAFSRVIRSCEVVLQDESEMFHDERVSRFECSRSETKSKYGRMPESACNLLWFERIAQSIQANQLT